MTESEDLKALAERGQLTLRLKGGEVAARFVATPALALMTANGHPPEGLLWGGRFFHLSAEGQYVEGLLYPLFAHGAVTFPYATAGAALTAWLTELARRPARLTLLLGTRPARVLALHPDGRLECEVETEALEPERQFVALEPQHLSQLTRQLSSVPTDAESTIPAAEKARRYRHKLVDLLEKAEATLHPGAGKAELAALADEAHTVRTQLDVEERYEARRQSATPHGGGIGAPRPQSPRVLPEGED